MQDRDRCIYLIRDGRREYITDDNKMCHSDGNSMVDSSMFNFKMITMKKLWIFILMLIPLALVAQQDSTVVVIDPVTPPLPENPWDLILNFDKYIISFPGIAVAATFLAALLNGLIGVAKKFLRQLVAWGTALVLLGGLNLLNIGYVAEFTLIQTVLHGFFAGLVANGLFDIPTLNNILKTVEGWFTKK